MRKIQVITYSCGKRGCDTDRIVLPNDGRINAINSAYFSTTNAVPLVLCLAKLSMDAAEAKEQINIIKKN